MRHSPEEWFGVPGNAADLGLLWGETEQCPRFPMVSYVNPIQKAAVYFKNMDVAIFYNIAVS